MTGALLCAAALKVIRQGILTPAPYVELHAYLHRLLSLELVETKTIPGKLSREASGSLLMNSQTSLQQGMQRASSPFPRGTPVLPPKSGGVFPVASSGMGYLPANSNRGGLSRAGAEAGAPRKLATSFVAIPIAPPGKVAGPLTPAEVQAIQAVVSLTDGPKLAWAVQGIMHHVFQQHGGIMPQGAGHSN